MTCHRRWHHCPAGVLPAIAIVTGQDSEPGAGFRDGIAGRPCREFWESWQGCGAVYVLYTCMSPVTGWEGHGEDGRAVRALSSRKKFGVAWLPWALYEAECSWNRAEQLVSRLLSILGFYPPPFPALEAREAVGKHQTPPHFSSKAGDSWRQLGPAGLQLVDTLMPATPQPWPVTAPNSVCKGPCPWGPWSRAGSLSGVYVGQRKGHSMASSLTRLFWPTHRSPGVPLVPALHPCTAPRFHLGPSWVGSDQQSRISLALHLPISAAQQKESSVLCPVQGFEPGAQPGLVPMACRDLGLP